MALWLVQGPYREWVLVADIVLAARADVKVGADGAPESGARLHLLPAHVARDGKRGCVWVVQVVQHHHAAVLGAPARVKLVVVALRGVGCNVWVSWNVVCSA